MDDILFHGDSSSKTINPLSIRSNTKWFKYLTTFKFHFHNKLETGLNNSDGNWIPFNLNCLFGAGGAEGEGAKQVLVLDSFSTD